MDTFPDNLQLPCWKLYGIRQPPTSSYNFQLPVGRHCHHGRHSHGHAGHGGCGEHGGCSGRSGQGGQVDCDVFLVKKNRRAMHVWSCASIFIYQRW